ncbi:hypothetical protein ACLBOM_36720 [Escherichia coli]
MKKNSRVAFTEESTVFCRHCTAPGGRLNVAFTRRLLACNGWLGIATGAIVINGYLACRWQIRLWLSWPAITDALSRCRP